MHHSILRVVTLAFVSVVLAASSRAQDPDNWREAHAATCQIADEPWRTIPWQTDLLAAQRLALHQDKPLFIWAMDGHPLGCT